MDRINHTITAYRDGEVVAELVLTSSVVCGRDPDCELHLPDAQVSRRHLALLYERDGVVAEDLGSANGSRRNAAPLAGPCPLSDGDELEVGPFQLAYAQKNVTTESILPAADDPMDAEVLRVCERVRTQLRERDVPSDAWEAAVEALIDENSRGCTPAALDPVAIARAARAEILGLGPLEPLLADETVDEIMVNGHEQIWVERSGQLQQLPIAFRDEQTLRTVIERIVMPLGRRIDEASPMVDARLADGSRVNAVIPPLALNGPVLTIRKFRDQRLTIAELIELGSLNADMAALLERAVAARANIVVSGGTGSGKTTLLNVLSGFIPSDERIVTIEDAAELKLVQPHVVRLETRPPNVEGRGAVRIRDLLRNALRMRPDRIVVGECRGGEALDMLQAMNTGHDGSLTTVHANAPRDAVARIETMCLMADVELPHRAIREQTVRAVNFIVQQVRAADGRRRISEITEITGMEGDQPVMQSLFHYDPREDRFVAGGFPPRCLQEVGAWSV